jgi:hypothetical protein
MIDASTHTRKIWRSHFDGADSTYRTYNEISYFHMSSAVTLLFRYEAEI